MAMSRYCRRAAWAVIIVTSVLNYCNADEPLLVTMVAHDTSQSDDEYGSSS